MHPAFSVIFFTTLTGAGYGLLGLLGTGVVFRFVPAHAGFGLYGVATALALISCGLLFSTFHLGRPERAWRAFSQWRSSWLSREGSVCNPDFFPVDGLCARMDHHGKRGSDTKHIRNSHNSILPGDCFYNGNDLCFIENDQRMEQSLGSACLHYFRPDVRHYNLRCAADMV